VTRAKAAIGAATGGTVGAISLKRQAADRVLAVQQ
jgi:hypothetical protein